ncbi:MAG: SPOR domain-containing protein [Candidatus Binatia bacterium]
MAERRGTGLTFGQLITLTFGFLLASVVIFVFGLWVGRDLSEQRAIRQRQAARVPLGVPPTALPQAVGVNRPPVTSHQVPAVAPPVPPTATAVVAARIATATRPAAPTHTRARPATATPAAAAGAWTVQAYATNDTVRAIMLARTLRAKGYDASTATKAIGGVTWYTVRVGRFRDRTAAKAMETKLRQDEGLEAASVVTE